MSTGDGVASLPDTDGFSRVNIVDIESELAARVCDAAVTLERPLVRTFVLNLIVFIQDAAEWKMVAAIVNRMATAHPIRVIALMYDSAHAESDVSGFVKVECGNIIEGNRLASEEIALASHSDASARLASVVRSVLIPELPIALWWRGGPPFLNRLFKQVGPIADKIIVDSIRFGDGAAALDTLRRLSETSGNAALADMNWLRTTMWRDTLAASFDDPIALRMLPAMDRCEIDFAAPSGAAQPSARSMLLAGWIIAKFPAIAGHGDIRPAPPSGAAPGAIVGLALRASRSKARAEIVWESAQNGLLATAFDDAGRELRRWRFRADPENEADLLELCVDSVARDVSFEEALRAD